MYFLKTNITYTHYEKIETLYIAINLIRKCLCKPGDGSKHMDVPEIKMDNMLGCINKIFLTIVPMRKIIRRLSPG